MLAKNDNALTYFMYYKEEDYLLGNKRQNIKEDQKDLVSKSSVNKNARNMLFEDISQDRFFANELSSSLKEVGFIE